MVQHGAKPPYEPEAILSLHTAFLAASPRATPPPTPWASIAIHGGVALLWLLLFLPAFFATGAWAWATGIVYVSYDTALLAFTAWHARTLLRPTTAPPGGIRPTLGVIIAARNEAGALPLTLAALLGGTDTPDLILIADDGSTDATAQLLAREYGLGPAPQRTLGPASPYEPRLRWLRLPQGGKARALNAAIELVTTDVVVTIDADTLVRPGAIGAMRAAFAEPGLVAATGVLIPVCGPSASGRLFGWFQRYEYVRNFLSRYAWMRLDGLLLISGAFGGFRRAALLEVGGFDPDCLVEDYELIHRLKRHAMLHGHRWSTRVLGDAVAITDAPSNIRAFLSQRRRWFGGFLQTQWWYRSMVGDARFGRLGTAMLPVKAFDTMQPIYGLTALMLLVGLLATGRAHILPAFIIITLAKIAIDLTFHLWSIGLYRRWTGEAPRGGAQAILASFVEPFSFQILRHTAAALGWVTALSGKQTWGVQTREAVVARA
jgi:cellulose synthase/poly-beta-1,6-N-acetylglucosamine synthase-like glycosyltransferase